MGSDDRGAEQISIERETETEKESKSEKDTSEQDANKRRQDQRPRGFLKAPNQIRHGTGAHQEGPCK